MTVIIDQVQTRTASIRDLLRAHTQHDHARLHEHRTFVRLFDRSLTIGEYRALARRLHGFYASLDEEVERQLRESTVDASVYSYSPRSGLLALDMLNLGFSEEDVVTSPRCAQMSFKISSTSLGGVLYVIEGATLGGKHINRAVRNLLDGEDAGGRHFWAWCEAENRNRWSMTVRYLEQLMAEGAVINDLKNGARTTFRVLADWLEPLNCSAADVPAEQVRRWMP